MRARMMVAAVGALALGAVDHRGRHHGSGSSPMITLLEQGEPVFGLCAPAPPRRGG
ncbi:MAG: hypothetical protein R2752_15285 [Vicinamibacterales bacterium]